MPTRRTFLRSAAAALAAGPLRAADFPTSRPPLGERKFSSEAVEARIKETKSALADPELGWLFENCFPNTLDTTVRTGTVDGKPDTFVITGDIHGVFRQAVAGCGGGDREDVPGAAADGEPRALFLPAQYHQPHRFPAPRRIRQPYASVRADPLGIPSFRRRVHLPVSDSVESLRGDVARTARGDSQYGGVRPGVRTGVPDTGGPGS